MCDAPGPQRKRTDAATSAGSRRFPKRLSAIAASFIVCGTDSVSDVRTQPGSTTLTRIAYRPTSLATLLARPRRPALLAEYAEVPNFPREPLMEPIRTIRPPFARRI